MNYLSEYEWELIINCDTNIAYQLSKVSKFMQELMSRIAWWLTIPEGIMWDINSEIDIEWFIYSEFIDRTKKRIMYHRRLERMTEYICPVDLNSIEHRYIKKSKEISEIIDALILVNESDEA